MIRELTSRSGLCRAVSFSTHSGDYDRICSETGKVGICLPLGILLGVSLDLYEDAGVVASSARASDQMHGSLALRFGEQRLREWQADIK